MITEVTKRGPLTDVEGFVADRTPVQIRAELEGREGIDVLFSEDEVVESELLLSDGSYRTFIKAEQKCRGGSNIEAAVAKESSPNELPDPRGERD